MKNESVLAWHFSHNEILGYNDGRKIVAGERHIVNCVPKCCQIGLHGSIKALDALNYAPGLIISRVLLTGNIDKQKDKLAATCRQYLWVANASEIIVDFARWCANETAHYASRDIPVASSAASYARYASAASYASYAARYAARYDSAASYAISAAIYASRAISAASSASFAASYAKQNIKLEEMLNTLAPKDYDETIYLQ